MHDIDRAMFETEQESYECPGYEVFENESVRGPNTSRTVASRNSRQSYSRSPTRPSSNSSSAIC